MDGGVVQQRPRVRKGRRIAILPTTRLGWWAVGLAVPFVVLVLGWRFVHGGTRFGLESGVAAGVVALVAIFRRGERAIIVFAAMVPLVLVVAFVLAELIIGVD